MRWIKIIGVYAGLLLLIGFGISMFVFNKIKSGQAYQTAVNYIEANQKIQQYTGKIKGYGFLVGASIEESPYKGKALLEITVHGKNGNAIVRMNLAKDTTGWKVTQYTIH